MLTRLVSITQQATEHRHCSTSRNIIIKAKKLLQFLTAGLLLVNLEVNKKKYAWEFPKSSVPLTAKGVNSTFDGKQCPPGFSKFDFIVLTLNTFYIFLPKVSQTCGHHVLDAPLTFLRD